MTAGGLMARGTQAIALALPLLLAACGSNAPPPAASPADATLAAAPGPAKPARPPSPWPNSRFFAPKPATPAPLFGRPKRPIRGPAVHTLRS